MRTTSYIRKKGDYWYLVFEWYKNGKKHCKSKSTQSTDEKYAKSLLDRFINQCIQEYNLKIVGKKKINIFSQINKNKDIYDDDISFCDFIYQYVQMKYGMVADNTYSSYARIMKNSLIPYFSRENKKLADINVYDIEKYYFHEIHKRNISANTIAKYHVLLNMIFKQAIRFMIIDQNPMDIVTKPRREKFIATVYNAHELRKLLKILKEDPANKLIYYAATFAAFLGLRREEVIGLKWDAIDLTQNIMTIKSTVTETTLNGKTVMLKRDVTKTSKADLRSFAIPEQIREIILEIKDNIEKNKEYYGNGYNTEDEEYLLVDELGNLVRPNYITTRFGKLIKRYKLKKIRFYDLRHSCATMLLESHANIKEVQAYLGHSSAKTTLDTYVHIINRNNINSVNKIAIKLDK